MAESELLNFSGNAMLKIRSTLFNLPRELSGHIIAALSQVLNEFEGSNSADYVDNWYRSADAANYNDEHAAAAYIGAYGPRSILKYQEAIFSLFAIKGTISRDLTLVDYGCGPCPGFAAVIDLWCLFRQYIDQDISLRYIGVERSVAMRNVGTRLCEVVQQMYSTDVNCKIISVENFDHVAAKILIVSNVMNEGEGIYDCSEFLNNLWPKVEGLEDTIVIEPATQGPASQLCSLAQKSPGMTHIGPCPAAGADCSQWTSREFIKRTYPFEYRCLGRYAPAARTCKYSLALLSNNGRSRAVPEGSNVIVGHRSVAGFAQTCRFGRKSVIKIPTSGEPWDLISGNRTLEGQWP